MKRLQDGGRLRLLLFLVSAIVAVLVGFVWIEPSVSERLIRRGGYFYILGVFGLWLFLGWRVTLAWRQAWRERLWRARWVLGFLVAATAFAAWSDAFAHKVLFDEYVLQGTAWHMHLTKEIGTPLRGYDVAGTWVIIDTFLDKRPYFFTFLVALLHDLTGFRLANALALNLALAFVTLAGTYWLVRALTARIVPALLAVALLATLPLFGQNATAAGMELLNLAMIVVLMVAATLYARAPEEDRLSFFVLGAVLLAQTRYESVLFVLPVAVVVVYGWIRAGHVLLPWPVMVTPLLLVPYAWHDRFVAGQPILWQLREGEAARFGWQYLVGNLEGARQFFFNLSPYQPNSIWLAIAGFAGVAWAFVLGLQCRRRRGGTRSPLRPDHVVVFWFALTVAANLGLLMFYYWSRLDEPVASRFALPLCLVLALAAGWLAHSLDARGVQGTRIIAGGLVVWLVVFAGSTFAHRYYTARNLVMHELAWELEQAKSRPGPVLFITMKAAMPFLLEKIPALNTSVAVARGAQIAWHLNQGTFREVLVAQVIRPSSAEGDPVVDPAENLPSSFRLRPIAQKRFGGRWIRISSVVSIADGRSANPEAAADPVAEPTIR